MTERLLADAQYAFRSFRKAPGSTAVAILTLGVGLGLNMAVFAVMNGVLFKESPFIDRGDRLLYVERPGFGLSYAELETWRTRAMSLEGVAGATAWLASLNDPSGLAEQLAVTVISADAFELIGQPPLLGRTFARSDAAPGATPVALLSHGLWERRYGRDPDIVGRTVRLELSGVAALRQGAATVIGVMPPGFSFPFDQDLWVPLVPDPSVHERNRRTITFLFGRVVDGMTVESARAELESIGAQRQHADTDAARFPFVVQNFREHFVGDRATVALTSMMGGVGFVLLIACANVANLMLARASSSSRDVCVRIALGAGKARIIRQCLTEGMLISAMGGVVGWGLGMLAVRVYALSGFAPFNYPHSVDLAMDVRVLLFMVAAALGSGLLFGLMPAIKLAMLDGSTALQTTRRGSTGDRGQRTVSTMVVAGEMALAIVLLAGAGVMIRSVTNVVTAPTGVGSASVLMAEVGLPRARFPTAQSQIAFHDRLMERLRAVAGVDAAAVANRYPTQGAQRLAYELPGVATDIEHRPEVFVVTVGPDYFGTIGSAVLAGRDFTDQDDDTGAPVTIVNDLFASQVWPGENPVGKAVRLSDSTGHAPWRTVVGVVSSIVQNAQREPAPIAYLPYEQRPSGFMYVFARTSLPLDAVAGTLRRELHALDPMLPGSFIALTHRTSRNFRDAAFYAVFLVVFAGVGLVLACVGVYAVMAYTVGQRTQEIGVRTALGASSRDVCALILAQGLRPIVIGLPLGVVGAYAVNGILASQLVRVSAFDPVTLSLTSALLVGCSALACVVPARQAARVDPLAALRHE